MFQMVCFLASQNNAVVRKITATPVSIQELRTYLYDSWAPGTASDGRTRKERALRADRSLTDSST
jgi:hypothetical protein